MNRKPIGLLWGALMLTTFVFCVLNREEKFNLNQWVIVSFVFFAVVQGFYISIQLGAFTSKVRKGDMLLLPISKAEFISAKMIQCFVLFPLLYAGFVVLVAWLISCYNIAYIENAHIYGQTFVTYEHWSSVIRNMAIWWPCFGAIYWTGAFYFGRFAAVKSALSAVALYIGLAGFSYVLFGLLSGHWDTNTIPLFLYASRVAPAWVAYLNWPGFAEAFQLFGCVGLVVMSVFKFKEKTL
jgi:hypothetical protein